MAALFLVRTHGPLAVARSAWVALALTALAGAPAHAQEDGFDWDESDFGDLEDDGAPPPPPPPPTEDGPDNLDVDDEDLDFEFLDSEDGGGVDLLAGEEEPQFDDNAVVYRSAQERAQGLEPEEEVELWEAYLRRYPNSAFEGRIRDRIDEVISGFYGDGGATGPVDALQEEIDFSQGLNLEIINPRTTIQGGFEWGLPDYGNIYFGYEQQVRRNLSVGGSLRRRYTGASLEIAGRYALIKSVKDQTLVTAIGVAHLNVNTTFIGFRPMIAAGKRFGDRLDVQGQFGTELELTGPVGLRWFGGANVTYRAAETVALFMETSSQLKNVTHSPRPFNFTVLTFGMKFMPQPKGMDPGQLQINVGANVPFATSYWMYHFGSVMAQINYYPQKR